MIRNPFLKIPHHGRDCFIVDWHMVRVDSVDLGPSFAAGVLQRNLDILEGLVNLFINLLVKLSRLRVPASWLVLAT